MRCAIHIIRPFLTHSGRRLDVFRSYACSGGPWFAASMVPRRTDWEVVRADRRTVALSYLGKPLTIWILGNMISMTTYIGEQTDHPCARLVMGWRTEADRIAVDNIRRIVHRDYLSVKAEPFRAVSLGGQAGREVCNFISLGRPAELMFTGAGQYIQRHRRIRG